MSYGLVPSKSTVYISNLSYDLSNNDIHKLFEKYGRIIKVTVLKDKDTRKSRGVAFILFLNRDDAKKCVEETNMKEMFGRTLKASFAKDNGRSTEFIRRKEYPDKTLCYECGESDHLSYKCPKNLLGERQPPSKKVRKRKKPSKNETGTKCLDYFKGSDDDDESATHISPDDGEVDDCETLSAAIALEREKSELEEYRFKVATGDYTSKEVRQNKKKIKKSSYFSDEEEESE